MKTLLCALCFLCARLSAQTITLTVKQPAVYFSAMVSNAAGATSPCVKLAWDAIPAGEVFLLSWSTNISGPWTPLTNVAAAISEVTVRLHLPPPVLCISNVIRSNGPPSPAATNSIP